MHDYVYVTHIHKLKPSLLALMSDFSDFSLAAKVLAHKTTLVSSLYVNIPCLYHVLVETISGFKPEIVSTKTWYKHDFVSDRRGHKYSF